jgi:hypothetical protein
MRTVAMAASPPAVDIQYAGAALSSKTSISHVLMSGVKPPKRAVAKLYAKEKPVVLILTGIISVRATVVAPL